MNRPLKLLPIGAREGRGRAELVPQARLSGPIPWVIAIMVMLTVIAAAGGLALRKLASVAQNELKGGITVQIVEARSDVRDVQARQAVAVLRALPGVKSVTPVPQEQVDALVEPWLGGEVGEAGIPVPALIDARLSGPVSRNTLEDLRSAMRQKVPSARIDAQSSWLGPVFGALSSLQWLALALVLLLALATIAAVLLATRSALGSNRETIEIVHLLGGTDSQIARIFQRSTGLAALEGGIAGFAAAVIVVMLLGQQFAGLGAGLISSGGLGWVEWLMLALVPLAGVALATLTARLTVLRSLARML
ncbi:ABC transporter permease [Novosphingobium sp. TH158]|uniref:cell division protein FtsX n=1 Tax=Novosphingobium sp. TH158 TaxID=2067455 RepID=UPI000C7B3FF8|nr:cell division protein [Novosphingobium sp. TH158]PLK26686.1 cell division protein [Novosphingobium sp. TH158]